MMSPQSLRASQSDQKQSLHSRLIPSRVALAHLSGHLGTSPDVSLALGYNRSVRSSSSIMVKRNAHASDGEAIVEWYVGP